MDLNTLWFWLIAVLFIGFFFLEGFDFGVGILLPFLGKDDQERRMIINTIGPFWDGNEVWLITAGGAMFAAFPNWYATLFSGFYLALVLMLLALIGRGVAFEFRGKVESERWRRVWDWAIFAGSFLPALLWGVALSNILRGVPIDSDMQYIGGFFNLLNPYSLISGIASTLIFTLHGALFLDLKVTDMFDRLGVNPGVIPLTAGAAMFGAGWFIRERHPGWAFTMTGVCIVFSTVSLFMGLYPRVMVSSSNPDWSLTIYNAASNPYTLRVMSIVAAIFVPIVLIYQGWSYYIFRKRITRESVLEY
jgi:cytochrome d ubiquinol oxidase subunit II